MRPTDTCGTGNVHSGEGPAPRLTPEAVAGAAADLGLAVFEWDPRQDRFRWSPNVAAVLGVEGSGVPANARALQRLLTPETQSARLAAVPAFDHAVPGGDRPGGYRATWSLSTGDGRSRQIEEIGTFVEEDGAVVVRGTLRGLADTPSATGASTGDGTPDILSRDALLDRLAGVLSGLNRDREGSAAFVVFAIDGLSRINSGFGFDVGDLVIATVARRIAGRMRQRDVLGHISGHRFGAVLHDCTEAMLAFAAERFLAGVSDEIVDAGGGRVSATVSIGGVIVPRNARDAATAALRAEEALAEARAAGGNRAVVYAPSAERDRLRLDNRRKADEIAAGLEEGRFLLAYQPIVDAADGRILHFEALSRLVLRDGVVTPAGDLIATAERLGLVQRIDMRSLTLALADLSAHPDLALAVNVSVPTALDGRWLQTVVDAVAASRDIAGRLTVEITETAAAADVEGLSRFVGTLKDLGCRLAIDDWGAGHTSMRALRRLAVDWVKIDGSYVRDLAHDGDAVAFVRALVGIAGHLGIRTVAEWVEDEASATVLRELGVTALQGHLVGRPRLRVPAEAACVVGDALLASPDVFRLPADAGSAVAA